MQNICDWRPHVVRLMNVQRAMMAADVDGLWDYSLPKVAASPESIAATERRLGVRLDAEYRSFLGYADGWPDFMQSTCLFGTSELTGPLASFAHAILDEIPPHILGVCGLRHGCLLPLAASEEDLGIFVSPVFDGLQQSRVVWVGSGAEVEAYDSFKQFYSAMVDYNLDELIELQGR